MALSSSNSSSCAIFTASHLSSSSSLPKLSTVYLSTKSTINQASSKLVSTYSSSDKWRANVSFFPAFLRKDKDAKALKDELLDAILPLDRGAAATSEDQQRVDQVGSILSPTVHFYILDFVISDIANL
uniref:Uncharacterized protein MANES_07G014600 n=1 Tax=Rhizophora mucronata TaxID=61149 RepID=A0A2P2M646_RHIMU